MNKNTIYKIVIIFITGSFLVPILCTNTSSTEVTSFYLNNERSTPFINNNVIINRLTGPSIDLKIKKQGDDYWEDQHLNCKVGNVIEFKINADLTDGNYLGVLITTALPVLDNDILKPMFNYIEGSASPIPDEEEGSFYPTNLAVMWGWIFFESDWNKEMTFKAKVVRSGTETIRLFSTWMINEEDFDIKEDAVKITASGCCFPAGTKITMADGTYKNIENVKFGDKILSYNIKDNEFTSWRVKMLGNPVHPVITINDGLIQSTVDHPFYIKKSDDLEGWGAYDPMCAENAIIYNGEILKLQEGDQLYSSNGEWITIENIEYDSESIQTYNILSYSGTKNYFANNILVYEEHPPHIMTNYFLNQLSKRSPNLEQYIRSSLIFKLLFQFLP